MFTSETVIRFGTCLAIGAALACALFATPLRAETPPEDADAVDTEEKTCPVLENGDWTAWINRQPGPEDPSLIVSGQIQLPTPGYTIEARLGPSSSFEPVTQIVVLDLSKPVGVVAQVLVTEDIQFSFPTSAAEYRSVIVVCASAIIGVILDVDIAY